MKLCQPALLHLLVAFSSHMRFMQPHTPYYAHLLQADYLLVTYKYFPFDALFSFLSFITSHYLILIHRRRSEAVASRSASVTLANRPHEHGGPRDVPSALFA